MGLIYTSEEFDCIKYLQGFALKKIQRRFSLSSNRGLEIIAKSLLYNNYDDLISDSENTEDYESRNGCFFSEFVLAEELGIELPEAYTLKKELDNHKFYGSGVSHGNIEVANLTAVSTYSNSISLGNESRLMFSYPIDFYTRIYEQSFLLDSGTAYNIEALWCDGFSFLHPSYFSTREHMKLYMESILESLLSYNHLVISYRHFDSWIEYDPLTYSFLRNNFENYLVFNESDESRAYGIYFPHRGKSLRKRLGFEGAVLVKEDAVEEHCKIELIDKKDIFKNAREKKGMTKTRLAELSHISVRTIFNIENRNQSHNLHTLEKIASVLELDISNWFSSTR